MQDAQDTTKVVILTRSFRVQGLIALLPGARLTDFLTDSKAFIAVTDAEVQDHAGNSLLKTNFLNVNRDQVEIILPTGVPQEDAAPARLGVQKTEPLAGDR